MDKVVDPCTATVVRLAESDRRGDEGCKKIIIMGGKAYLRLGHLIVVMRKCKIDPAGMDVHVVPQYSTGHHRALDMPPRATSAPWRWPRRFAGS